MEKCRNCGNELSTESLFCTKCGLYVERNERPLNIVDNMFSQNVRRTAGGGQDITETFDEDFKKRREYEFLKINPVFYSGSRNSFLVAVLIYIANVMATLGLSYFLAQTYNDLLASTGMEYDYSTVLYALVIYNLPAVLISVSLIIFYIKCKMQRKTYSLLIIKVVLYIYIAALIFVLGLAAYGVLAASIGLKGYGLLVVLSAIGVIIAYYLCGIIAIRRVHQTMHSRCPRKLPRFLLVVNWTIIVFRCLIIAISILSLNFSFIIDLLSLASLLLFTLEFKKYNERYAEFDYKRY